MQVIRWLHQLALALPLCACSGLPNVTAAITPYRMDVRQGNMVTQEMAAQLKPGMTKDQVRFALGTALVSDVFHADRWDYVYRFNPGRGETHQRRVTVFFEDGRLARVTGDVVAAEGGEGSAVVAEPTVAGRNRVIEIGAPSATSGAATLETAPVGGSVVVPASAPSE